MKPLKWYASFMLLNLLFASPVIADTVVQLTGRATEPSGKPLSGNASIVINFYEGEEGELPVGSIEQNVDLAPGGVFSLAITPQMLSDVPADLWLEITINDEDPLPRQRVSASFLARRADKAGGADERFVISSDEGASVTLQVAEGQSDPVVLTLPSSAGAAGDVLVTDGAGNLSWQQNQPSEPSESTNASNLGSGAGLFSSKSGSTLQFKSIQAGSGVSVSQSAETVTISANTGGLMSQSSYDANSNGVVDNSESLGGMAPSHFLNASNINAGTLNQSRIDTAIARKSDIIYQSKQDLNQALAGDYADANHGHDASDIVSGIVGEANIDSAIARDSEITYKDSADLRQDLDSVYANTAHNHQASEIVQDSNNRMVSDAERISWNAAVSSLAGGQDQQVLSTDGQGSLIWRDVSSSGAALRDQARDLVMTNSGVEGVRVTIAEVIMQDSNATALRASSIDETLTLSQNLDAATPSTSTWYHIWLISDGQSISGLFSLSASQPTLPNGWAYRAYIGAVYNEASGSLSEFFQRGKKVLRSDAAVLQNAFDGSYTAVDLSNAIPSNAASVYGEAGLNNDFSVYSQGLFLAPRSTGFGERRYIQYSEGGLTADLAWEFSSMIIEPQQIYYRCYHNLGEAFCSASRTNVFVTVKGWTYP